MADHRLLKKWRLRNREEFERVFQRRRSVSDGMLVMYGCHNNLGHSRMGLVVSRKMGNAVRRNRWKRLLREAYRLRRLQLPEGMDMVVIPRKGVQPELCSLARSLKVLSSRLEKKLSADEGKEV